MKISKYYISMLTSGLVVVVMLGACGGHPNAADVPDMVTSATADLTAVDMEIMQAQEILAGNAHGQKDLLCRLIIRCLPFRKVISILEGSSAAERKPKLWGIVHRRQICKGMGLLCVLMRIH